MKANIAVATVSGKAYYLIVSKLKERNISFLSLTPSEPIPVETKAVITTEREKHLINHERVLVYRDGEEPEAVINEALQIIQGKEFYEKIAIGIDPGDVFGLAVLADGKVIETANCFSVRETLGRIERILLSLQATPTGFTLVKVGDGVPKRKEELLQSLDKLLPSHIVLESVSEKGTNSFLGKTKHRRGLRDIASAIKIAGRSGQKYVRRKTHGENS
ncbi:MAG: hypothetical protein QHH24_01940 [Candidatus Bathyarchaeota archaeon]|nr:hypothetical protein [Candidatus Bathyarchaeota archaeon]